MDYRQGEDERGDWYNNSVDSDAQFAAQLQRQLDDEDTLIHDLNQVLKGNAGQLESGLNYGQRPSLDHSIHPESSNNLKNDEEFARRLQRKFFLDLKKQGFGEIDIASMLDSLSPDHHQRHTDPDFEMAIRASLGDDMVDQPAAQTPQSFLEKFLLTLYSNCRYNPDSTVAPPPTDDFSIFREQASGSIKVMTEEMLISVEKVVELMLDKGLNSSQTWNDVEAALFVIDSISGQMNTSDFSDQKTRLMQHITSLKPNSNPLLINTSTRLIGNLSHWLYMNKAVAVVCVNWILSLPPYENLLLSVSQVLEKLASLMPSELADSFKSVFDFIPYVELTTDRGSEMETAALHLIRACTHLLNDRPSDQLVDGLKTLTDRPVYALSELAGGNHRLDEQAANNSWHVLAMNPGIWLQRIYHVFKTLHVWDSQSEYLGLKFAGDYPVSPWTALSHDLCEVICRVITAYSNDKTVVDNCCLCVMQIINTDLSSSSIPLIGRLLDELVALYSRQPQSRILQLAGAMIEEFTIGIGAEETIANFLNAVCIQTDAGTDLLHENPEIIQNLFSVVNSFTRLRLASFVDKPAAQLMFELAISGLTVEQNEIHKYARTFIFMFLSFSQNKQDPQLTPVLQNIELVMASCFEKLIDTCLRIAFSETSITLINTVAEVLAELLLFENQRMDNYLDPTIQRLVASHGVSAEEINNFEVQLRNSLSAEDVLNAIVCFSKIIHN